MNEIVGGGVADMSGLQPSGAHWAVNLGLRPRLVYYAPLALGFVGWWDAVATDSQ